MELETMMSEKVKYELLLAAHRHVETMIPKADDVVNLMWYGWALRDAFIAGVRWQVECSEKSQADLAKVTTDSEAVMDKKVCKFTSEKLDEIAGRARTGCGIYSWRTVYQEFVEAGLSPEDAERATDERVMVLD